MLSNPKTLGTFWRTPYIKPSNYTPQDPFGLYFRV